MQSERILFFEGVGEVSFKRSKRAKRLTIRVKTTSEVTISIPWLVSFAKAEAFVLEKSEWIRFTLAKISEKSEKHTIFNELTEFSTLHHELKLERIEGEKILRKIAHGKILVSIPFTMEVSNKAVQLKIKTAIIDAWRIEAKAILPQRIKVLAEKYGFMFHGLSIKNMKSRWGSCTGRNTINLNLHLVRLPTHLCDYVILHELVHTVHKNHGKYFWENLDTLCGDSKALAKELKNFRLDIW